MYSEFLTMNEIQMKRREKGNRLVDKQISKIRKPTRNKTLRKDFVSNHQQQI